jgi:sulfoacetaldehyde acetyltransferase
MTLISEADVVLALGTRINPFGTLPQHGLDYWPTDATIIQVDADHRTLGLTKKVQLGICGDAKATAELLLQVLAARHGTRERRTDVIERVARERRAWADELEQRSAGTGEPISPRRALALLRDAMPADAIVSTDIGNICSVANSYLHFENPRTLLAAMTFGNCGYAYPTALGAKLAAPDRPVIAYVGDGAWGMSMAEVMTAVREDIPAIAVVWNNSQWGAEKKNQVIWYGDRYVGSNLANPNFADVAKTMGANGITVEKEGDLQPALHEAIASGRPTVMNVVVDSAELGEPFRPDALRYPVRHLEKYAHLSA